MYNYCFLCDLELLTIGRNIGVLCLRFDVFDAIVYWVLSFDGLVIVLYYNLTAIENKLYKFLVFR